MSINSLTAMARDELATGKDIILDIVENMRANREELLYSTLVPTLFEVHLHAADYNRLEGIFPMIAAEGRRALAEALARDNRLAGRGWLQKLGVAPPVQPAHESWTITFHSDEDEELRPGEIMIVSRLTLPPAPELGAGTRTRRITTSRLGSETSRRTEVVAEPAPVAEPPAVKVFATLTYEDNSGRHTHPITESQLVIGRGGAGYWVDLRVDAAQDVSREHVRLRRDETTGQFYVKDLSTYGTTVNGQRIATSIDASSGTKRDLNVEIALPAMARIGLAEMVFLDFRQSDPS